MNMDDHLLRKGSARLGGRTWAARAAVAVSVQFIVVLPMAARGETLEGALARAYQGNPVLSAQRASLRATNEGVPQAKAGQRPRLSASADASAESRGERSGQGSKSKYTWYPRGMSVSASQNLFDGFRTPNKITQAEAQVFEARQTLRSREQGVLLDAATAYLNVLRDTSKLDLQRKNVEVLQEQLRQSRDRFSAGEITRTDVAQSESRLASAHSQAISAEATLRNSVATYRQNVGQAPTALASASPADRLLPPTLEKAVSIGLTEHPNILAALHNVEVTELQVTINKGELLPSLDLTGAASQRYDYDNPDDRRRTLSAKATLSVPIYEGGQVYSKTRQSKETVQQAHFNVEAAREEVRAGIVSAWGQWQAGKAQIEASQKQVASAEIALAGIREEAAVGQRTTLDILNSQQELLNARVDVVTAQRDRIVASYSILSAMGRLSIATLKLKVAPYDERRHLDQVKDLWFGTQVPDGR